MNMQKTDLSVALFSVIAVILLAAIYVTPIWWVSLKAPNYPPEAFPDGVRIHFHMNGVFNGCKKIEKKEIFEEEELDCVHEMDTINHYVGMYPIAAGAPVERGFSQFLIAFLGVMILAFAIRQRGPRTVFMAIGFIAIAGWMMTTLYSDGGVMLQNEGYQKALMKSLDLDVSDIEAWSGYEAMTESYRDTLGIYFRETDVIEGKVAVLGKAIHIIAGAVIGAMLLLLIGGWLSRLFYWLLALVPIFLPVYFLMDYSAWLWWFGHNMNAMGAFTVKPFMPTVFGDGKVAQFSTHSYPYTGFGLMMLMSVVLIAAVMYRRKQLQASGEN